MHSAGPVQATTDITSFEDILVRLRELDATLANKRLPQFLVFNTAYVVVTDVIKKAVDNGQLTNPTFVEAFSACFARFYFQAVAQTARNDVQLPPAWSRLNKAHDASAPAFILLLMGANAHINYDLPLALAELATQKEASELVGDVIKIDKLLMRSGREILGLFEEHNTLINMLKRRFVFLYYRPVMYMILYWRVRAWHSYKQINEHGVAGSNYAKRSDRIARRFLRLGALLGKQKNLPL